MATAKKTAPKPAEKSKPNPFAKGNPYAKTAAKTPAKKK